MINKSFNISKQISNEDINRIYDENFKKIIFEFANFQTQWLHNASINLMT